VKEGDQNWNHSPLFGNGVHSILEKPNDLRTKLKIKPKKQVALKKLENNK